MKVFAGAGAAILLVMLLAAAFLRPNITIAIQPLGPVDTEVLNAAEYQIRQTCKGAEIVRLAAIDLPSDAYHEQRDRYSADKLLDYLTSMKGYRITKVIGITASDISTPKGDYPDWGVLGLAHLDGSACIVSTHRIRRAGEDLFIARFRKVVVHEAGHTFGMPHCGEKRCVMQDYKGSVATLDGSPGNYCGKCRHRIERYSAGPLLRHLQVFE